MLLWAGVPYSITLRNTHFCRRQCVAMQVMKEERQSRQPGQRHVGCTACIKKLQRHDNGIWPATLKVLAEGALCAAPLSWSDLA